MNFDPKNLFIGLMDLFTILMPGALFVFAVQAWAGPLFLGDAYSALSGSWSVAAFLFASYLFGHFVFLLSTHLDDAYDAIRNTTHWCRMSKAASGGSPKAHVNARELRELLLPQTGIDKEVKVVARIKELYLDRAKAAGSINAFQWSKLKLQKDPEAFAVVQRFEADSKFFRSFSVVLAVLAPIWMARGKWELGLACLLLMGMALWRYVEQRLKSTQQAYRSIISMHADGAVGNAVPLDGKPIELNAPTHAGGVVYRREEKSKPGGGKKEIIYKYLIVRANSAQELWVLPKGHIEDWESPEIAAVREVLEETGVWAAVEAPLDDLAYDKSGEAVRARIFRMRFEEEGPGKERREKRWLGFFDAHRLASHDSTRALLTRVHEQLTRKH